MQKYKCRSGSREELQCYQPIQGQLVPVFSFVYIDSATGHKGSVQVNTDDALRLKAQLDEFLRMGLPMVPVL